MERDDDKLIQSIIPKNVIAGKRHMGIRGRNIAEGIVLAVIVYFIISQIPFVARIKAIFIAILCISAIIVGCIGIKDRSITEFIMDYSDYKKTQKIYHLRTIKDSKTKKKKFIMQEGKAYVNGFSIETEIYKIKQGWADFKAKYGFR